MAILRWILVLPAAVLAQMAVQVIGGTFVASIAALLGSGIRDSSIANWAHLLIAYMMAAFAFVFAGAKVAPRKQIATGFVLTALGIALSLTKHVVGQHLAGNRVGVTNYLHASLETAGFVGGAVFIFLTIRGMSRAQPESSGQSKLVE